MQKHAKGKSSTGYTRRKVVFLKNGRGDRIRTCDPLVPNQMRYQAALLPDMGSLV